MEEIKVSIITVCFNSEATIERTIKSVLNQSYKNIEYIIVDGASTDSTMDIVDSYRDRFGDRLKVVSEKDDGIYFAMNKGIKLSSGQLIGIINSDDWYELDAVERVVKEFEIYNKKDKVVIHGLTYAFSDDRLVAKAKLIPGKLKELGMGSHPSCFVTKHAYEYLGGFDEKYRYVADYDFMIRAYDSNNVEFIDTNAHVANAQLGGASSSTGAYKELLCLQGRYKIKTKGYIIRELFKASISDMLGIRNKKG